MLNKELSLNECVEVLNDMAKSMTDYDADSESVIYIMVEPSKIDSLKKLIPGEVAVKDYLNNFGEDWERDGFDISGIWGEVCSEHNSDIWFTAKKKEFYINQ